MSLTSTDSAAARSATVAGRCPDSLARAIRADVRLGLDWQQTAGNPAGSVSGFAPPGDIHRVRNTGDSVAISMHVYGADISRLGNSIRREYALPVRP